MHRSARTASEVIEFFNQCIQQPPAPKEKDYQQGRENEKQKAPPCAIQHPFLSPFGFVVGVKNGRN